MKITLQLEQIAMFVLGIYGFTLLTYDWWVFVVLFLLPDLGMIGYLINPRTGALVYNIFHHRGLAILVYLTGVYFQMEIVQLTGIIVFSHIAFDRFLGYGLKYAKGFKFTHLGIIGKEK